MNRDHFELAKRLNHRRVHEAENKRLDQMEIEGSMLWWIMMLVAFVVVCLVMAGEL